MKAQAGGTFYPDNKQELKNLLNRLEASINLKNVPLSKVLVLPHAGLIYSGIAALKGLLGFKHLTSEDPPTFLLLGQSHYYFFHEVAILNDTSYHTPLGEAPINTELAQDISNKVKNAKLTKEPFLKEHSLEMLLVVLQHVLADKPFNIVPILVSDPYLDSIYTLKDALSEVLQSKNHYLLVSSDLSHYPLYEVANQVDMLTIQEIAKLDPFAFLDNITKLENEYKSFNLQTCACGKTAITISLFVANELDLWPRYITYHNSGDIVPMHDQVVGYTAFGFVPYSFDQMVLHIARLVLDFAVRTKGQLPVIPSKFVTNEFLKPYNVFVTLLKDNELRGCIGTASPAPKKLIDSLYFATVNSAFNDIRFDRVTPKELIDITLEVSLLSEFKKVESYKDINLKRYGVILRHKNHEALFLPEVAEKFRFNKKAYFEALCQKAGLPKDCYKDKDTRFFVFTTRKIVE